MVTPLPGSVFCPVQYLPSMGKNNSALFRVCTGWMAKSTSPDKSLMYNYDV